jgi:hypothetical protein
MSVGLERERSPSLELWPNSFDNNVRVKIDRGTQDMDFLDFFFFFFNFSKSC